MLVPAFAIDLKGILAFAQGLLDIWVLSFILRKMELVPRTNGRPKIKKIKLTSRFKVSQVPVAHICNPSYLGG
jgi:hypothetical protein